MSFPKNKRRTIMVDGLNYEWCYSHGSLYYKGELDKSLKSVYLEQDRVTPADVYYLIKTRSGTVPSPQNLKANKKKAEEHIADFKLFVWTNVLRDFTSGIMFAYARSLKEARKQIKKSIGEPLSEDQLRDLNSKPTHVIMGKPKGFYLPGGG